MLPSDLNLLHQSVQAIQPLAESTWQEFATCWETFSVKRKEVITAAGTSENYLYFVTEGVQRIYYLDQDKESTIILTYAPSFGGVLDSFLLQKPSRYYYESLTPSRFLRAKYEAVYALMQRHPDITSLIQIGVTHSLSGLLERMVELQCFSSEEKFKQLLKRSPHILTLVPHKYLANYLGIDPTNFSKLINSVRI